MVAAHCQGRRSNRSLHEEFGLPHSMAKQSSVVWCFSANPTPRAASCDQLARDVILARTPIAARRVNSLSMAAVRRHQAISACLRHRRHRVNTIRQETSFAVALTAVLEKTARNSGGSMFAGKTIFCHTQPAR